MKIDPVRLARQELAFNRWRQGKSIGGKPVVPAKGIIKAVPGFGKTYILVLAIRYMNQKYPDRNAIVVVPSAKLLEDWMGNNKDIEGHIKKFKLTNVRVFIVNTYVKYKNWKCDLLGLDECHRYANEQAVFFSTVLDITTYKYILLMTATLTKEQQDFFEKAGIPVVDEVNNIEAQKNGYTASSIVYNLGIKLSTRDQEFNEMINKKFNYYFSFFSHELSLVIACNGKKGVPIGVKMRNGAFLGKKTPKEWIEYIGKAKGYDGTNPNSDYAPSTLARSAAQCMAIMGKRKQKWQNFPSKLEIAVQILRKFPLQTMVFSETGEFADKITALVPDIAMSYHTRLKTIAIKESEIIEITEGREESTNLKEQGYTILGEAKRKKLAMSRFLDPNDPIRVLSTVRAADEGVDIPNVALALMVAYNSTKRQDMQRGGRSERKDYNNLEKCALIINLYMMGTQEEKWLREKQKGRGNVMWVTSIEEINPTRTISLGTNGPKEVTIEPEAIKTRVDSVTN